MSLQVVVLPRFSAGRPPPLHQHSFKHFADCKAVGNIGFVLSLKSRGTVFPQTVSFSRKRLFLLNPRRASGGFFSCECFPPRVPEGLLFSPSTGLSLVYPVSRITPQRFQGVNGTEHQFPRSLPAPPKCERNGTRIPELAHGAAEV